MTEFEKQCYGMSEADIREQYMNSITGRHTGQEMVVMGILSDCQELLGIANYRSTGGLSPLPTNDSIRMQLNIAKFILSEIMDNRLRAELLMDELTTE